MNKKILVMPDGNFLAHTSRPLEIAKALREAGYEILFAGDGNYMNLPRKAGFKVINIKTINPERVMECARKTRCNFYDYDLIKELVDIELRLLDQVKPDLVLADFRVTLSTSCELAGIPLAIILNAIWTNYYSANVRAPEHLTATRIFGERLTTFVMPWIEKIILITDSQPFKRYRKNIGLNPRKNFWDYCMGDLNFIVDIPKYGPTKYLPDNFHYIGPIIWEPDIDSPEWLKNLDHTKPTIYITMGSTGYPRFFKQAVEIFGNSNYQCIMTTGGLIALSDIPNNFFVADYLPGSEVMKKSDVVISHGGNGTIYQAMEHGIPIIGIPTWGDQEWNLQMVESLGIGIQLSELKFKPTHLSEAVEKIFTNKLYKTNALHYKNVLDDYNAPKKAVQLISSFFNENMQNNNVRIKNVESHISKL